MISAERYAKDNGCAGAAAAMNIRASTYETFTVTCATGDPRLVRCDDGVCRELK
jgi:UDP-N-acetylenolpyruvoylglucosamine reductase